MRFIAVEEHYANQQIIDENERCRTKAPGADLPEAAQEFMQKWRFTGDALLDVGESRTSWMDAQKVDVQILSYTAPVDDSVPAADAVRICREANDILAEVVATNPASFAAFATLPMADSAAAATELKRCVEELGFKGALLTGTYNGRFFDAPEYFDMFKTAADLDVPISWHPEFPAAQILTHYYLSDSYSLATGLQFGTAGFGWHLDVGLHMARVILSGIFDKLPNLKFISGHWGETVAPYLDRMDAILRSETTGLKKRVSDYYHENVWFTPSGILSKGQLNYFVSEFGADRIIWALDYPYIPFEGICSADFLLNSGLPEADIEAISHGNAEKLFKL